MVADTYSFWLNQFRLQYVPMLTNILSSIFLFPVSYTFAIDWQLGVAGLAYAYVLYYAFKLMITLIYTYCLLPQIRPALFLPTMEVFNELRAFLSLAVPSVI